MKTTTQHQDVDQQQQILDLLHQLAASVDRLSADVQQLRQDITRRHHRPSRKHVQRVVVRAASDRAFTSLELYEHRMVMPELREVFDALHITSARLVGRLLQRMEGQIIDGRQLQRIATEHNGSIIWRFVPVTGHCDPLPR